MIHIMQYLVVVVSRRFTAVVNILMPTDRNEADTFILLTL